MIFQYFLPGFEKHQVTRAMLVRRGLAVALRDCLTSEELTGLTIHTIHSRGPSGSSGVIVAAPPVDCSDVEIGYYPDHQTWEEYPERYWLGTSNAAPPAPEQLIRIAPIKGAPVPLGDGRLWDVPVLRRPGGGTAGGGTELPRAMKRNKAGEFGMEVIPDCRDLWDLGGEIWALIGKDQIEWSEAFDMCCRVLSANYRVGPDEISRLGLITTVNFMDILKGAIDWPLVREMLGIEITPKKRNSPALEPVNSSPGPEGDYQTTTPVAENYSSLHAV